MKAKLRDFYSIRIGRLWGIDMRLNIFLIVLAAAAIVFGWFTQMAILFAIIFLHELCHVLTARAFGLRMAEIELMPFGGVARMEGIEMTPKTEALMAAAGPAFNLLLGLGAVALWKFYPSTAGFSQPFAVMNLSLAIFNLIPAIPLDGGRILRASLAGKIGVRKATAVACGVGIGFSVILTVTGVCLAVAGELNFAPFALAVMLVAGVITERRKAPFIVIKDLSGKRERMKEGGTLRVENLAANKDTKVNKVLRSMSPDKYHRVTVIDDQCAEMGVLGEDELLAGMMELGGSATLEMLLQRAKNVRGRVG